MAHEYLSTLSVTGSIKPSWKGEVQDPALPGDMMSTRNFTFRGSVDPGYSPDVVGASGGYIIYPNRINTNYSARVYSK